MDANFDLIKIFVCVVKYNSFSKAAVVLHMTQSAVSQSIKRLENNLGITLIERGHNLKLTEKGKLLYKEAALGERSFNLGLMRALNFSEEDKKFRIKVSSFYAKLFINPFLSKIKESFPRLKIEFVRTIHDYDTEEELKNNQIDLTILNDSYPLSDDFYRKKLCDLDYQILFDPKFYELNRDNYEQVLRNASVVIKNRNISDFSFYRFLSDNNINHKIEVPHDEQIIDLIINNNFIGFCPLQYDYSHSLKSLDVFPDKESCQGLYLVTNGNNDLAIKIIDIIKSNY